MPSLSSQNKTGNLYLIPNIIHPGTENKMIPPIVFSVITEIDHFLVENIRSARRYLSSLMKLIPEDERIPIEEIEFDLLDKDSSIEVVSNMLRPMRQGKHCGIISESGCPGIADPGSVAVKIAHQMNAQVIPLPGPSSIFMALMASGMNGQSFSFHGYLPIDKKELGSTIRKLENHASKYSQTQIFIETPYRNQRIFDTLISTCQPNTILCIAKDITGNGAFIKSKTISEWRSNKTGFEKVPVVFLIST